MANKSRRSFKETLADLAPRNVDALGRKAGVAASLAGAYPENAAAFRAIETRALAQIARVLGWEQAADNMAAIWQAPDRELVGASLVAD